MSDLCVREGCRNLGAALVQAGDSVAARESPRIAGSTLASAKVFQASVEASRRMQAAARLAQEIQSLTPVKSKPVRWWNKVIWWLLVRRPLRWFFIPGDDVVWTRDFSPTDADCPKSTGKVLFSSVHRFFGRSFVPLEQFEREQGRARAMQTWLGSLGLLKDPEHTRQVRAFVAYLQGDPEALQELGLQKVLVHPEEEEAPGKEPLDHVSASYLLELMQSQPDTAWTLEAWKQAYDKRYGTHIDVGELLQVFKYLVASGHARPMGANQYQVVLRHKGIRA